MVITELAVFENRNGRLVLTEIANDTTLEEVQAQTGFPLEVADNLGRF
jgi:acyl CoA:acetate/3-ketoacid CoA transferase beta subunit